MKAPTVGGGCKELAGRPLVSCNRSSQQKSAPKERHNVAHGVKPWVGAPSLSPFPSPARAGEGCRRRGEGLRTQGSRPGLRYSAASRLSNRTPGKSGVYERTSVTGRLAVRARGAILAEPRSLFFRGGRT